MQTNRATKSSVFGSLPLPLASLHMAAEFTRGLPVTTSRFEWLKDSLKIEVAKAQRALNLFCWGDHSPTRVGCADGAGRQVSGCKGAELCEVLDSLVVLSRSRSKRETLHNQISMIISTDGHGIQIVNQGSAFYPFCSPLVQFKPVRRVLSQQL